MAKVGSQYITVWNYDNRNNIYVNSKQELELLSWTAVGNCECKVTITTYYADISMYDRVYCGGTLVFNQNNFKGTRTVTFSAKKWDIISVKLYNNHNETLWVNGRTITIGAIMIWKNIKVFETKSLWEKATLYLFGMLPTGVWRDGN